MRVLIKLRLTTLFGLSLLLGLTVSCRLDMRDQPRVDPYEASAFFANGASARSQVQDTVARGQLQLDTHLYDGRINNRFAETIPFTVTLQMLERGHERYDIFCAPCHGLAGDGRGIVTEYGMAVPTSFHAPELRDEPVGYYFSLITNGNRLMPSYAARIPPEDRWAIIAYIRALQLSQNADATQLSVEDLSRLNETDGNSQ